MIYAYISEDEDNPSHGKMYVDNHIEKNAIKLDSFTIDPQSNKISWEKRDIFSLIQNAKKDDIIITYEASNLARSTLQLLEILEAVAKGGLQVHFIKYNETFVPETAMDTKSFLRLMQCVEEDFLSKRTVDALARRRAAGLPLGRPKGRKNKCRKLDKHRTEIKKYLALNISKASIAKLVGCHAQTLYNYLEDTNLTAENEPEEESQKLEQATN
ncbi:MAG: Site-specific recombinase related to the invertase Pin [Gammaproteobacteria bacterium]|jgi:DNA invertase Pin-like site-specific DNA recombinase|nr:Site-specific recombinase related to the invertase Pin [Gammaproteobacteria bacterium]